MSKKPKGVVKKLGLSWSMINKLRDTFQGDEETMVYMFGLKDPYGRLIRPRNNSKRNDVPEPKEGVPFTSYSSFGAFGSNFYFGSNGSSNNYNKNPETLLENIDPKVALHIPLHLVGSFQDVFKIEYIPFTDEENDHENLGWYFYRCPIKYYSDPVFKRDMGVPKVGNIVYMKGRGMIIKSQVATVLGRDSPSTSAVKRAATGVVKLVVLETEDESDYNSTASLHGLKREFEEVHKEVTESKILEKAKEASLEYRTNKQNISGELRLLHS